MSGYYVIVSNRGFWNITNGWVEKLELASPYTEEYKKLNKLNSADYALWMFIPETEKPYKAGKT